MKKTLLSFFFVSLTLVSTKVIFSSSSQGRANAANSGNTGAPGENTTCRTCHGTGFGVTISIDFKNSNGNTVTKYLPGQTYEVTTTINHTGNPSGFGYQIVSLTSNNQNYNAWSNPASNVRIASAGSGRSYAEQKGPSNTSSFTVDWTAPVQGTGDIVFYAGGNAVNLTGGTGGDGGNTTTLTITEDNSTSISEQNKEAVISLYPNPAVDNITINYTSNEQISGDFIIVNLAGKTVKKGSLSLKGETNIQLDDVSSGVYFFKFQSIGGLEFNRKLIVK